MFLHLFQKKRSGQEMDESANEKLNISYKKILVEMLRSNQENNLSLTRNCQKDVILEYILKNAFE